MEFEHGGYIYNLSYPVIDFSSNVNPLPFPKTIAKLQKRIFESIRIYPDPFIKDLSKRLSEILKVREREILFGNGSTELIYMLLNSLRPKSVLIPKPTFSEYKRASSLFMAKIEEVELKKDFRLPLPDIKKADMFFLCHPNNPTGNFLIDKREDILDMPFKFIVIDEAFIEFSEKNERCTFIPLIEKDKRIIVLRTFTKFFPLAGIRIGYLIAHESIIERLSAFRIPWNVNGVAILLARYFLDERDFIKKTRKLIEREKRYLIENLKGLGLQPYPSETNFILLKLKEGQSSKRIKELLLERKILIRDCSNFSGLDERFIRISVRKRKENRSLIEGLREICISS